MNKRFMTLLSVVTLIFTLAATGSALGKDTYRSISALKARETKNVDYRIRSYDGPQSTLVMAIHGGGIEFGTSQLAKRVAKLSGCDYYTFEGLKNGSNWSLHITSTRFNERIACKLVSKSTRTLSLHGCSGNKAITYLGGRDTKLGRTIEKRLEAAGFRVYKAPAHLDGKNRNNICNENKTGKGVQLELTRAMRERLIDDGVPTAAFYRYARALSAAL